MTRNDLYDAVFRYKKAGLWKKIWDTEIFAFRLRNGEIGYISIMGKNGEFNALGLYIGKEGIQSYKLLAQGNPPFGSPFKEHEYLLQQKCLQAALGMKDDLMPEEAEEVRAYAKAHEIKLTGKNAYPQFIKYEPCHHPWKVQSETDMEALYDALTASCLLADMLKETSPAELNITSINEYTASVPLFELKNNQLLSVGRADLPDIPAEKYEYASADNQISIAMVKKLPQAGIWDAELLLMMTPVQENPEDPPYYPTLLMIANSRDGHLLHTSLIGENENNSQSILQNFAKAWKKEGVYPKEVRCRDERTYALLKAFCEKTNVKISIYKGKLAALDEAQNALLSSTENANEDDLAAQLTEFALSVLNMSKEEFALLPKPMIKELCQLVDSGILPKNIARKLSEKIKEL